MNFPNRKILSNYLWVGIIICSVYFLAPGFKGAYGNIGRFLRHRGQNHEILLESPIYRNIAEIKNSIPPESRIQLSSPGNTINRVAARYYLYPMRITDDWQYFVDFKNINRHLFSPKCPSHKLASGGTIYAVPGNVLTDAAGAKSPASQTMAPIIFLAITLFKVLTGYLSLKCMDIHGQEWGGAGYIAMSYLMGELLLSAVVLGYLLLGGDLARGAIVILWTVVALILLFIARRDRKEIFIFEHRGDLHCRPQAAPAAVMTAVFVLFLGIIVQPVIDWDAMSFWMMKAKVLYYQQALDLSYTHNNNYPMLWPVSMASQFILLGTYNDQMAQWASGLFFIILILQVISALRIYKIAPNNIAMITLLFLGAFFKEDIMSTAKAENLFLAYTAGMVTSLLVWFRSSRKNNYAWLVILMAAALAMIKFEGFVTSLCLGLSLLILNAFRIRDFKTLWFSLRLIFLVPMIELLWIFWCCMNDCLTPVNHLKTALSFPKAWLTLTVSARAIIKSHFFIVALCALLLLMLKKEKFPWTQKEKCLLYLSLLLFSFSIFLAFIGLTPIQIIDSSEAVIRLLTHAAPALVVLWASRMFRPQA